MISNEESALPKDTGLPGKIYFSKRYDIKGYVRIKYYPNPAISNEDFTIAALHLHHLFLLISRIYPKK